MSDLHWQDYGWFHPVLLGAKSTRRHTLDVSEIMKPIHKGFRRSKWAGDERLFRWNICPSPVPSQVGTRHDVPVFELGLDGKTVAGWLVARPGTAVVACRLPTAAAIAHLHFIWPCVSLELLPRTLKDGREPLRRIDWGQGMGCLVLQLPTTAASPHLYASSLHPVATYNKTSQVFEIMRRSSKPL